MQVQEMLPLASPLEAYDTGLLYVCTPDILVAAVVLSHEVLALVLAIHCMGVHWSGSRRAGEVVGWGGGAEEWGGGGHCSGPVPPAGAVMYITWRPMLSRFR